jgi:hypothetical protein
MTPDRPSFTPSLKKLPTGQRFRLVVPSEIAHADRKWFAANPYRRTYVRTATLKEVAKRQTSGRWLVVARLRLSRRQIVQHFFCVADASLVDVTDEIGASVVFEVLEGRGRLTDDDIQKRIAVHSWLLLADLPVEGTA